MGTSVVTARVDAKIKKKAQKIAKEMWINLSTLVNVRFTDFVRNKKLHISLYDDNDIRYYESEDMIDVHEPAELVRDYLKSLVEKDEQTTDKVST